MRLSEPIPGEDYIAGGMASVLRNRLLLTHQRFSFPLSVLVIVCVDITWRIIDEQRTIICYMPGMRQSEPEKPFYLFRGALPEMS